MTPPAPAEVAGLSLAVPRLFYDVDDPSWGSATLARPHAARALDGATLVVRLLEGNRVATFELTPFLSPAVQPYTIPPAAEWRALLVDQRLLSRPELVWTGAFPEGWAAGLAAPWAEALADALTGLYRRHRAQVEERYADWSLRTLECAECRAERAAKMPAGLTGWQLQLRLAPSSRCTHAPSAMRALGALCRAHPELTFELLGWIEPAGARAGAEGPPVTRFALHGKLLEALVGPWLVGDSPRLAGRTIFRESAWSYPFYGRRWGQAPDPKRPLLPREQRGGVALAASAWGVVGEPEALVEGDEGSPVPGLDRAAAPPIEAQAALPGQVVRRKRRR